MSLLKNNYLLTFILVLIAGLPAVSQPAVPQPITPLRLAAKVADRIIRDTRFSFTLAPQKEASGLQVLDLRFMNPRAGQTIWARRKFRAEKDTTIQIGIQSSGYLRIWVNEQPVYQQETGETTVPVEYAYDRFHFSQTFTAAIKKGKNELLIAWLAPPIVTPATAPVIFLRPQIATGLQDTLAHFDLTGPSGSWLFTSAENSAASALLPVNNIGAWQSAPAIFLPQPAIDSTSAYQRESFADWSYPSGILMWTILQLGENTADTFYQGFVTRYKDFVLQHKNSFQYQYDSLFALRCCFYRLFRQTMLDDAAAPALPFLALQSTEKQNNSLILEGLKEYFAHSQPRLPDNTFCRPEPTAYTVWADDLFMSTPVLIYMARLTGQNSYLDEAASQTLHFQQYLYDSITHLYRHGWFSQNHQQAPICWGRANGWIAWANALLLDTLSVHHPLYHTILTNFRRQMTALLTCQAADGMWRQVLDDPSSYEETSCTAMFALAMAKGVRRHWLPGSYSGIALKAWKAVAAHITPEGIVKGICRGTEIGPDRSFYNKRATYDNDPRGLGAVIAAAIEIEKIYHQ